MQLFGELFVAIVIAASLSFQPAKSATFTIIAPQAAVPGSQFKALLYTYQISGATVSTTITVRNANNAIQSSFDVISNADTATPINIQLDDNYFPGSYTLTAAASDGSFSASTSFDVIQKSHSIFVQTDKAIYKPSQTVKFRVLVTSADLKPYDTKVTVTIQDSQDHKIRQWLDQALTLGVASFELSLSDQPPLGNWSILVAAGNQRTSKSFSVEEYTLPRYGVTVSLPSYITVSQQSISVSVSAQYTYGENVQGTAVVLFTVNEQSLQKISSIDGVANFVLTADDLSTLGLAAFSALTAVANVTETLTGTTLSGSSSVAVSQYDAQVVFLPATSDYYKRGLDYTAYMQVSHPDGSLLSEVGLVLEVSAFHYYDIYVTVPPQTTEFNGNITQDTGVNYLFESGQTTFFNQAVSIPYYGLVAVTMTVPADASIPSFTLQAQLSYHGQTISVEKYVTPFQVEGSNNIRVSIIGSADSLQSGDTVSFAVTILQPSSVYYYIAEARGNIVSYSTLEGHQSTFDVLLTTKHAPQTTFIVYVVGTDGELVADSVTLNVGGVFLNKISLSFLDDLGRTDVQAEPGDNVTLRVSTSLNSLVGLLAVDQSVLLLKGGNDITQNQLLTELNSFSDKSNGNNRPELLFFWPYWGGSDSSDIFTNAKLSLSTDAILSNFYYYFDGPGPVRRPPIAGVGAPGIEGQQGQQGPAPPPLPALPSVKTRSYFPETWIWSLLLIDGTGVGSITQPVPDTITTWVTTAFSMNAETGLAVTPSASKFKVFKNFFVSAILPYSVVRGEEASLKAVVFNYMDTDQNVRITIPASPFYTARLDSLSSTSSAHQTLTQTVVVAAGSGSSLQFWINPQVLGTIKIVVSAVSPYGGDQVENDLLVKPEGVEQKYCLSELVLQQTGSHSGTFSIQYPSNVVSGSKHVEIGVSGDIMGPSIQGLDQLVQVPYGCGEQNMITVCPNIFVREYLEATGSIDPVIQSKTQTNMLLGYQRELTYWRQDGFFSAFGDSDSAGSTWLTAFVIKSFRQAEQYLTNSIDDNVFTAATNKILQERLTQSGSFIELGRVIHVDMQGGSGMGEALTAYILIALLEDNPLGASVLAATPRTVPYLENALAVIATDPYKLAIVTYSLVLANSPHADASLELLESLAIVQDGTMHWSKGNSAQANPECYYCPIPAGTSEVEMTSYALLTYVSRGDLVKASQVAKWLSKQRSSLGGFESTQDTVLGLQALAKFAKLVRPSDTSLTVTFSGDNLEEIPQISITNTNSLLQQSVVILQPDSLNSLQYTAAGQGSVILSTCVSYYALAVPAVPAVTLVVTILPSPTRRRRDVTSPTTKMQLCAASSIEGTAAGGMGIIHVNYASGYSVEAGSITDPAVRRADYSITGVSLYFDQFDSNYTCATITMQQTVAVNSVQDSYVSAYPYYNPTQGHIVSYNPVTGIVGTNVSIQPQLRRCNKQRR